MNALEYKSREPESHCRPVPPETISQGPGGLAERTGACFSKRHHSLTGNVQEVEWRREMIDIALLCGAWQPCCIGFRSVGLHDFLQLD
jgi:hypothetical protein